MIFIFLAWDKAPNVKNSNFGEILQFFYIFHITGLVQAQKVEIIKNPIQRLYNL